jgi:modulator of FtsH protease HflK
MPWNSDDGGGNQGPWGQGPKQPQNRGPQNRGPGGGPGGSLPPDIDDLLRKSKDNLKNALPGGPAKWLLPVALLGAFWLYNSMYQVQPDERGVVLRLGEYNRTAEPGLHFAIWPIETMEKPKVGAVQQIDIGRENNEGQMLTSDKNIIAVSFSVQWRISDPQNFLFNIADQNKMIRALSQSVMREVVGQTTAQMILTTGKDTVAAQVLQTTQSLLDEYKSGVILTSVNLGDVQPPAEVADAFAEVVRAGQDAIRLQNEAQQNRNQRTQAAEGEVARLVEDANAYKSQVIAEAEGESARFISVYDQYKDAKDVTRRRLFLETMEKVLAQSNKVIVESGQGGSGVVPYLPLPELQRGRAAPATDQPAN